MPPNEQFAATKGNHMTASGHSPLRRQRVAGLFPGNVCAVGLLSIGLLPTSLQACGPDFPLQLLSDRGLHLQTLPEPTFAVEVLQLASPVPSLPTPASTSADSPAGSGFSSHYDWQLQRQISATEQAEQQLLTPAHAALVQQMRQQNSAQAALQLGAALPAELRLYTAAAVAFQQDPALAAELFLQVLALPAAEQSQRRSWALFSLGRLRAAQGDSRAASSLFSQLQQEVNQGLNDPLQLAVASLGEQARLLLAAGDWQQAIGLYAAQAHYEESGRASLKMLATQLLALSDTQLQPLLAHPNVSRLLSIYLLTQLQSLSYSAPEQLSRLLTLLQSQPALALPNALELAAISYQQGQYQTAGRLLPQAAEQPLKWWLTAKLALRNNQLEQAAVAYAKASKAFPIPLPAPAKSPAFQYDEPFPSQLARLQLQTQCRVQAEAGVLQLQRGEYIEALRLLYQAGPEFWQDTAYVAERVLTSQELQTFVEQEVPAGQAKPASEWAWFGDTEPNTLIRQLLARRLMREGLQQSAKLQQAQQYFVEPQLQQLAQQYLQLHQASAPGWLDGVGVRLQLDLGQLRRAEALFEAARLTRQHGLALFGYEMAPDYQVFYGQFAFEPANHQSQQWPTPAPELSRLAHSVAVPDKRFHYRYRAAELAAQSADLWPQNSQAFAASLCHATTWLINREPALAQQYYQRYLQQGPYVSWGADFGRQCPTPDAAGAAKRLRANFKASLPADRYLLAGALGSLLLFTGIALWWHRRH